MEHTDPSEMIRALDGLTVPGGCEECSAIQTLNADEFGPGMHGLRVAHEDECPVWVKIREAS